MPGRVHHPYETLIYLSYRRSAGLRHLNCNGSCGGLSKAGKRRGACHCAPLWPVFAAAQVGELIKSTKKQKKQKQNGRPAAVHFRRWYGPPTAPPPAGELMTAVFLDATTLREL